MGELKDYQQFVEEFGIDEDVDQMYLLMTTVGECAEALAVAQTEDLDDETMDSVRESIVFNLISSTTQFAVSHDVNVEKVLVEGHSDTEDRVKMQEEAEEMFGGLFGAQDEAEMDEVFAELAFGGEGDTGVDIDVE